MIMTKRSKYCLFVLTMLVLAIAPAFAGTPIKITTIYNTGVNDAGVALGVGIADPHYNIVSTNSGEYTSPFTGGLAYTVTSIWLPPPAGTNWITPTNNGTAQGINSGTFDYQTSFDVCCMDPETVCLTGVFAADNSACVYVNGAATAAVCTNNGSNGDQGFKTLTPISICYSPTTAPFVAGVNRLDFKVWNESGYSGLVVQITGTGN